MDILAETDNTTKNIVQEIIRESLKKDMEINEGFCTYYVKLLTLDPVWGISAEKKINRILIQALVSWLIEKFANVECISLTTITMQQYFISKYMTRDKLIQNHYDLINSIVEPLLKSITDIPAENMQHTKSRILKRMTLYIIMVSKMGDVKDHLVFRETSQALKSIIDEDDLNGYINMNKKERRTELIYKQKVVMGIRLFNSDSGRQTATIADLPKIIQQSASVMQIELQNELCYIMDIVNLTTTAIESVFVYITPSQNTLSDKYQAQNITATVRMPEGTSFEDLEKVLNILVLVRQHEVYLRKFLLDLKVIQRNVNTLLVYFRDILSKLHNSVKYKIAVMASTVYPLFVDLGEIWISIQEETIAFSHLIQVFKHLESLTKKIKFDREQIYLMIGNNPVMTDAMRLEKTTGIRIGQLLSVDCQILDPLDIEDFENLHLEFLGFCIWKFILTNGALIPGNPNMGVLKWEEKYYVFSIPQAAIYFAQNPKEMVMNALTIARKKPELITLLQIQEQIYKIRNVDLDISKKELSVKKLLHKEIQTEIHPIESKIDKKYEWNKWNMLKESLVLADISRRQTHATQTISSHLRCNTHVQTVRQKNKNEQTKKDNYTSIAPISHCQFGLRGRREKYQHRIELTCPIEENSFYNCATANIVPIKSEKRKCVVWKASETKKEPKTKSKIKKSLPVNKNQNSSIEMDSICSSLCVCELSLSVDAESEYSI